MFLVTLTVHAVGTSATYHVPVNVPEEDDAIERAIERLAEAKMLVPNARIDIHSVELCPEVEDPTRPFAFPLQEPEPVPAPAPPEIAPGAGGLYLTTVQARRGQDVITLHIPGPRHLSRDTLDAYLDEDVTEVRILDVEALPAHEDPLRPWCWTPDELPPEVEAELTRLGSGMVEGWASEVEREAEDARVVEDFFAGPTEEPVPAGEPTGEPAPVAEPTEEPAPAGEPTEEPAPVEPDRPLGLADVPRNRRR